MSEAMWWYEWNGAQAGPVGEPALLDLVRSGRLGPGARAWRSGMTAWEPISRVPELAVALPAPNATPPPLQGAPARPPLPQGMEPVSSGAVIGLGILTFGIYPMIKFYQAGLAYEALAGRPSRFVPYFWLSIGFALGGGPLHLLGGVPGYVAHVAALVFMVLTLVEVLDLRSGLLERWRIAPELTSEGLHKGLFIAGLLTSFLFIGVVLLIVQAVKFFQDHAAIAEALRGGGAVPAGAVAGSR